MTQAQILIQSGRHLARAVELLDRADEFQFPSTPEVITKMGLLDEARREIARADSMLGH